MDRKNKKPMPTSVRLDDDVKREIEALARADERSVSSYINRVLRAHIATQKGKK